jgi:thiopeptide-type bacteriocin biosynthesis protein
LVLIAQSALSFRNEFNVLKSDSLKEAIKDKYRKILPDIEFLLTQKENKNKLDTDFYNKINSINNKQKKELKLVAKQFENNGFEKTIDELMPSYIHMFLNRFFASNQRFEEMMIYQILEKYYLALKAREKYAGVG